MNAYLQAIRDMLESKINDIDAGNSNIDESGAMEIVKTIKDVTDMNTRLSKYEACQLLNISRATFDNYVRLKELPKGEKKAGFKELSWSLKDINDFRNKYYNKHGRNTR